MAAEMAGDGVKVSEEGVTEDNEGLSSTAPWKIGCVVTFAVYLYAVCI